MRDSDLHTAVLANALPQRVPVQQFAWLVGAGVPVAMQVHAVADGWPRRWRMLPAPVGLAHVAAVAGEVAAIGGTDAAPSSR